MLLKKCFLFTITISLLILFGTPELLTKIPAQENNNSTLENQHDDNTDNSDESTFNEFENGSDPEDRKPIFSIGGQFKNLFTYTETDQYSEYQFSFTERDKKKRLIADLKRIRLSPEINISDFLHIHVDYDNEIITGTYLKSLEFDQYWRPSEHNDLFDLSYESHYDKDVFYRTKVHRAFAKLVIGDITMTLGRQLIRFGSGKLWNPLDILNPISPTFVEGAEDQKGTDALRIEYYFSEKTELALVLDQKRIDNNDDYSKLSSRNSNLVARFKTTIAETEIAALGGQIARRQIGGTDISTILLDGMLRGSVVYSKPETGESFIQGSAGYEYNFSFGLYFLIEYFYNENALNFNNELMAQYWESLISGINENNYYALSNNFLTFNQHYSGIALGYDFMPLLRGEVFAIYDFQGKSLFYNPALRYNAFENINVFIGFMKSYGIKDGKYTSDFEYLEKYSFLYASLVWYF